MSTPASDQEIKEKVIFHVESLSYHLGQNEVYIDAWGNDGLEISLWDCEQWLMYIKQSEDDLKVLKVLFMDIEKQRLEQSKHISWCTMCDRLVPKVNHSPVLCSRWCFIQYHFPLKS